MMYVNVVGGGGEMFPVVEADSSNNIAAGGCLSGNTSNVVTTTSASGKVSSKSHSEAERRRRQRINAHLSTLRTLLPNTSKMDKASLLTEVVRQVRELRRYADDVAQRYPDTWHSMVPGESDEVKLDRISEPDSLRISVCCEDRPGLMTEMNQAIRSAQARAVRAEIATVGGRTKTVVFVDGELEGEDRSGLHDALRTVLHKPGSSGNGLRENKRLRFCHSLRINN